MIRVRFHGRGGQGVKTAGRVLGTAALLDGFTAQDSPVYGAERRGAPMTAYVRIAREAIFERGAIPSPHLVVVADDTLLDDPSVKPLAGLEPRGVLLIATSHSAEEVRQHTGHPGPVVARDFVALALEQIGSAAGVSTAVASAACALHGLSVEALVRALHAELGAIGLSAGQIQAGLRLAEAARAGIGRVEFPDLAAPSLRAGSPVVDVTYAPPEMGAPTVTAKPNTPLRKTGNWRVFRPVIALDQCTQCWICFVRCPEGAIELDPEENPYVDYEVCKGCLICIEECPTGAITKVREVREWAPAEAVS